MSEFLTKSKDDFGDRMKGYETIETSRCLDIGLPIYARIDGRGFSKVTKGMHRPFDARMSAAMIDTTAHLVKHTSALIGFTQSDEISLGWRVDVDSNPLADMFFSGKVQKLCSVLAGMATAAFTRAVMMNPDEDFRAYVERLPHFDARVFNLPSNDEFANAFLWRELDATRNAVSMAAFAQFSHKKLHGVSCNGMRTMLADTGIDFEAYPAFFKRGTYVRAKTVEKPVSDLPIAARTALSRNANAVMPKTVMRTVVEPIDVPPLLKVINRGGFILGGDPKTAD